MFNAAEGLGASASRSVSASRSQDRLPPTRGLAQATGGVPALGPPPRPGGHPGPPGALGGPGIDSGNYPVAGFAAPAAAAAPTSRALDALPVSRGVSFESQAVAAVPKTRAEMGLPAPGVPVQPIDAEAFFDEDPAMDSSLGAGGFTRSGTGLKGGTQVPEPSPASSPAVSGFGVPALGDPSAPQANRSATVPAGHDHAAQAFANAQSSFGPGAPLPHQSPHAGNQATVAAPAASASAQLNMASPLDSQPLSAPPFGQMPNPAANVPRPASYAAEPAPPSTQTYTAPPVASGIFGASSNPTDVHQSVEAAPLDDDRPFNPAESGLGAPREESGLWGAQESKVIALPDVPMPTSFDSTQVDALPPKPDPGPQTFGQPAAASGIRQLSGSSSRSSFAASSPGPSFPDSGPPAESEGNSTVFRLADLDGESGFELDPGLSATVRRTHTEDVPRKPVTQQIDPLVEFHDVFQDIRKAEKGDDRSASERYFDTGLFSGVEERSVESQEKAQREREDREARAREGRLNLKAGAGGLAARIEKEVATPEFEAEDDDMLAAALADSGLREPSMDAATVAEQANRAAMVDLDVAGESAAAPAFPNAARYLSVVLVLLVALMGVLGFIAMRNDGVLDLRDMGQMMGVAFRGEAYEPRHQSVVQIVQTAEGWVEEPLAEAPANDGNTLAVADVVSGQFEATHGAVFTLVDGTITNTGDAPYRAIAVEIRLLDAAGDEVATRRIPAGAPLDQPSMEDITDADALEAEYLRLGALVSESAVEPGATTAFSGAFLLDPETDVSGLTASARVVAAQRPRESWGAVEFSTPDAETLPTDGSAAADEAE